MPPPSKDQVKVALEALRTDAQKWDDMSATFRSAAQRADSLDLSALHFTYLAGKLGLVQAYQELQNTFITLLNEGATNFANMAAVLRKDADDYQHDDEAGAHAIASATY
jgi:hypothetical protein